MTEPEEVVEPPKPDKTSKGLVAERIAQGVAALILTVVVLIVIVLLFKVLGWALAL